MSALNSTAAVKLGSSQVSPLDRCKKTHSKSPTALSLVADEVHRLAIDIETLRNRCERSLQTSSGFSPFLFANQPGSSEQQQLPQAPTSEIERQSKRRSGAAAGQSRIGGTCRSVELPDAFVSGVGVAFAVNAVTELSPSAPTNPPAALLQESGGGTGRHGRTRIQDLPQQQQQQLLPCSASSTIETAAPDTAGGYPPITQSQMIGSLANPGGVAGPQSESRRLSPAAPTNQQQQQRSSTVRAAANQSRQEETAVEKFRFSDPAAGANQSSLFLQRLGEVSALQAETVRHEKMKANKRKFRC